jgi:hypothetical protein
MGARAGMNPARRAVVLRTKPAFVRLDQSLPSLALPPPSWASRRFNANYPKRLG